MTFSQVGVGRVRIGIEGGSAYAVDLTDDMGDLYDLRTMEAMVTFGQVMVADGSIVQRFYQRREDQLGFDRPSFELSTYFVGSGQTLNAASTPAKTALMRVLESIFGGYESPGAGSAVVASPAPTTTVFTVTTGHGTRFKPGGHVWVDVGGVYECNVVKSIATDALTFKWAFSAAPATAAVVLNSLHVYDEEPAVAQTSVQVLWEAATNREHIFLLSGGQATALALTMALGEQPTWAASMAFAKDTHDDSIATPQGGSAIAAATYDGGEPTVFTKGGLLFGPVASTTRTLIDYTAVSFAPNVTHSPITSPHGTQGIRKMWRDRGEAPSGSFTCPLEGTNEKDWTAARDAKTPYQILHFCGGSPGDFRASECGTLQIVNVVDADVGGRRGVTVSWKALEDSNATDQTTSFRRSPQRHSQS